MSVLAGTPTLNVCPWNVMVRTIVVSASYLMGTYPKRNLWLRPTAKRISGNHSSSMPNSVTKSMSVMPVAPVNEPLEIVISGSGFHRLTLNSPMLVLFCAWTGAATKTNALRQIAMAISRFCMRRLSAGRDPAISPARLGDPAQDRPAILFEDYGVAARAAVLHPHFELPQAARGPDTETLRRQHVLGVGRAGI